MEGGCMAEQTVAWLMLEVPYFQQRGGAYHVFQPFPVQSWGPCPPKVPAPGALGSSCLRT